MSSSPLPQPVAAWVRPHILALQPYTSARSEHSGPASLLADANESPYGQLNRYPDPLQKQLRQCIAELHGVDPAQVFVGNGSDEAIDLLLRIFCTPGRHKAVICPPTYGMYEVSAAIQEVEVRRVPLLPDFQLDLHSLAQAQDATTRVLFLCTPNNPTGNALKDWEAAMRLFEGMVVVDEAYAEFSDAPSAIPSVGGHPQLVVLRTLSKAYGLAGARVGYAVAHPAVVDLLQKVKPPYNVSQPNQQAALAALADATEVKAKVSLLVGERERMASRLAQLPVVRQVFPSQANFLLVQVQDAAALQRQLLAAGIVIRNRHSAVPQCLRITVGTPEQNDQILEAFSQWKP